MATAYVPERGDIVWIDCEPKAGHEQGGHRPALVLSKREFNEATTFALFCPITSQVKGYPFEVELPAGLKISGAILTDQVKSLSWDARNAEFIESAPAEVLDAAAGNVISIVESVI